MKRLLTLFALALATAHAAPANSPTLNVQQGTLSGKTASGVQQFLGVPYAAPPLGPLRWQPPQPPVWKGKRDARQFGAACAQGSSTATPQGSEDCLTLNIYRPPQAKNAPLMVWVHGGFFTGGDAGQFDGSALAREHGVVVVTVNYRVGLLGFLAAPGIGDGNYGLMDIQAALRWLRANAGALGADAGNITLFGQSAGASAICSLMTAPSSAGLFQKAILQSGSCAANIMTTSLDDARRTGTHITQAVRCGFTPPGECLRRKSLSELTRIKLVGRSLLDPVPLPPVYGDGLLPLSPVQAYKTGQYLRIPVLLGMNRQEGEVFEPFVPGLLRGSRLTYLLGLSSLGLQNAPLLARNYPIGPEETPLKPVLRLLTDQVFACPTSWLWRQLAGTVPTYAYEFSDPRPPLKLTERLSISNLGAYHGAELSYVLDTPVVGLSDPRLFSAAQQKLAQQMGAYWTSFARTGTPQALALNVWPPVNAAGGNVLALTPGATQLGSDFEARHQCGLWDGLEGR